MYKQIKKVFRRFSSWMHYDPPGSMTSKGWRLFDEEYKRVAPIRHWISKDLRHAVVYPIKWKYQAITNWIRYRTYDRYHVLKTGLEPGYYEVEKLMLHVNFNMLKDFVEDELAWSRYLWTERDETATWCEKHMPFYYFFKPFRRPDLGIKHLEWASTLDDPNLPPHERCDHQAVAAREMLILYKWWVEGRPSRKEEAIPEYDHQGMGIMGCLDDDFDQNAPDFIAHREAMDRNSNLEETWSNEDEEMLIRLMKVRRQMWT